ncbi:unnamed protein product, partial [Symbiodinium pilosum]
MEFVGHGRGDFEKEKVTVSSGVRFRAVCVAFLCFLLFVILGLLVYLFMPNVFFTPGADEIASATDICTQSMTMQGTVAARPMTTYYTNVKTEHVAHVVPVPIPGPPPKVITHKVYVKHHPYDCTEGYGSWKTQWSHEHQRYCCYKFKESCTTK